ncbi:MAG: glutamate racemase [uncultured bacterium]|nr:MAG: glutamate racemase [uncultured bacterium]
MIGFFDSGVGGLTIIEEVHKLIPEYSTVYLGDSARAPYGNKTHDELVKYAWQGAEWLFAKGCDLVIFACNSASASALREIQQQKLQKFPDKRILGVIGPTVEEIAKRGHKNILVLSTVATKESGAYANEFKKLNPDIQVFSHACPNWGPMVEQGMVGTEEMFLDVKREISEAEKKASDYDAVLLACTHYPYVQDDVKRALYKNVPVYDQGGLVALSLKGYLLRHPEIESGLEKNSVYQYFVTGDPVLAQKIASERFGFDVDIKHVTV